MKKIVAMVTPILRKTAYARACRNGAHVHGAVAMYYRLNMVGSLVFARKIRHVAKGKWYTSETGTNSIYIMFWKICNQKPQFRLEGHIKTKPLGKHAVGLIILPFFILSHT